ncbi:diacylglycerol/lipid kinase family protein [Rossellomorea aquimaris]|uniref:diacylglycerol/lipid kinase family protein n=1 Tax=Rossellomorea aquimaris TaxID=189382 RepID=UPI0007D05A53|nr:YegS/Rv2252/BmrU family lipid kinase [Rossellomorea aquimaris]
MKKAMLIVNPSSGKEKASEYVEYAINMMKKLNYDIDLRETKGEGDATDFAREACEQHLDFVAAMGGDGTMNEVINGLAEQEHRPVFGLIPLGTVNDFARALNIPMDPKEAITIFEDLHTVKTDIGKMNDSYFMNIIAVGALAEASFSTPVEQKTKLGPLAYIVESMKKMKEKQPFHLRVESESGAWEGDALLMLVALTNSVGGFETITPEAEVNDGKLHVMIIEDIALSEFLLLLPKVLSGKLTESEHVYYKKTTKIEAFSKENMIANVDGDEGDPLPITVENLEKHLEIFVPKE